MNFSGIFLDADYNKTMYRWRYIEIEIEKMLKSSGAVLVTGPKFIGKTTTCMRYQKSFIKLDRKSIVEVVALDPKAALIGEHPRLIDEWQSVPELWDTIKSDLDDDYVFGKYILTGSSTPVDVTDIYHNGAGRISTVRMRPMSLFESGDSSGAVSLDALFSGANVGLIQNDIPLSRISFLICRGGWPISVIAADDIAIEITRNYYNGLFYFENSKNGFWRNKKADIFRAIIRSYARNISTEATKSKLIEDVRQNSERSLDPKTFDEYKKALEDLFLLDDIAAWSPSIRSKTSIRSSPVRHLIDPSLGTAALAVSPKDLINDIESFGLFFEDLAVRDLSVYASALGGEVRHYRDNTGLEVDAVVHLRNGQWGAIEIKTGGAESIENASKNLQRLADKLATKSDERKPAFLMVLTAVGNAYTRKDGVHVVPLTLLKA